MATNLQNSSVLSDQIPSGKGLKIGIVVSQWHKGITQALLAGALDILKKQEVAERDICIVEVPGSIELTFGARQLVTSSKYDAVICLGCVIKGETPHFDYVCQSVTQGITSLNVHYDIPVVFGVLTTLNLQQARDRAGGKYGNKGAEAAATALYMAKLKRDLK